VAKRRKASGKPRGNKPKRRTQRARQEVKDTPTLPPTGETTPASPAEEIVGTIGEAALALSVAPRTLATWLNDPTFPGKAGHPGRGDGHFPIAAIRAWHLATHGVTDKSEHADEAAAAAKVKKAIVDSDRAHLALERELKSILDAEEFSKFLTRMIATAKAVHDEMPDRVEARLPGSLAADVKQRIRQAVEATIVEAMNALAEAIAGDTDETDDLQDDDAAAAA
jgi:hypothetical protein